MREPYFRTLGRQADRIFERGVAAAQGGQRMIAAGLLRQVVRLNPQHEQAWLWLSGVIDDPDEAAFCLRTVLNINPYNERAREGLAELSAYHPALAQSQSDLDYTRRFQTIMARDEAPPPAPWWMGWRDARIALQWTVRLLWLIPLLLLGITLGLRAMLVLRPLPDLVTYRDLLQPTAEPPAGLVASLVRPGRLEERRRRISATATANKERVAVVRYLDQVRGEQERLRQAVTDYRSASEQSRTAEERTAAARKLSEEVERGRAALAQIVPPAGAADAHTAYLDGLALESVALENLVTYYSTADSMAASRAAVRLQDARDRLDVGKAGWEAFAATVNP